MLKSALLIMRKESLEKVGIEIGHYTDVKNLTGTTVFLAKKGADIGIDIRGSSTGSINTPAYSEVKSARRLVHGIVLTGGSSYGMETVFGVMQYLEEQGVGTKTREGIVPGITGAVIYDLGVGNPNSPRKDEGYFAAKNASLEELREGNIGVGTGATTGKWIVGEHLKGGFGMAEVTLPQDMLVCAFVVTNSVGDIVNPQTGKFYTDHGGYDLSQKNLPENITNFIKRNPSAPHNTTLAVIAANVALEREQLLKVAELAHDGMARSIFPTHTMMDGDVIFAISSHSGERKKIPSLPITVLTDVIGLGASDSLMKAIKSSILHAESIEGFPAYKP